jgi:hypothetical protein
VQPESVELLIFAVSAVERTKFVTVPEDEDGQVNVGVVEIVVTTTEPALAVPADPPRGTHTDPVEMQIASDVPPPIVQSDDDTASVTVVIQFVLPLAAVGRWFAPEPMV